MNNLIRKKLRKFHWLRNIKHRLDFFLWKIKIALQSHKIKKFDYDPSYTYYVDPKQIRLNYLKVGESERSLNIMGTIEGGNWDKRIEPFESCMHRANRTGDIYRSFIEHYRHGMDWLNTDYYRRMLSKINNDYTVYGCSTQSQLNSRFDEFDTLYIDIKNGKYRTQCELQQDNISPQQYGTNDEIRVHIGRDGDYLFCDGRHRLCIAKILELDKVPVKVSRRHKKWVDFRKEILEYAKGNNGKIYQPILHPDLADIPSGHNDKRWQLMRNHIQGMNGRVLDIGANWGYFSQCFESLGFDCIAVEIMPRDAYFLRKLKRAQNRKFQIIDKSILDYSGTLDFTIVLALNIFHHFLKTEALYNQLSEFLSRLNCQIMFFQPHLASEPQMKNAFRNYDENEYVKFIQKNTGLETAHFLGKDDDGRSLYKLQK